MLEKLSSREKYLLTVLLVAVLLCVVYFGVIKYLYPQYRQIKGELDLKREQLAAMTDRISRLDNLEDSNKEFQNQLQNLTEFFNKEVRTGINYYYIGKHAKDNSIKIKALQPQAYVDHDSFLEIPLKLTVQGQYQNVLKFIAQVENDMPNSSEIILLDLQQTPSDKKTEEVKQETNASTKENQPNAAQQTGSANALADKASAAVSQPEKKAGTAVITEKNPDVEAKITMVTYAVKSPEIIELAGKMPLGRWDAFSPTVDFPVVEPDREENSDLGVAEGENMIPSWATPPVDENAGTGDLAEPEKDQSSSETTPEKPLVPEVQTKDTGNYSFPERQ